MPSRPSASGSRTSSGSKPATPTSSRPAGSSGSGPAAPVYTVIRVPRTFVPSEAYAIAAGFRAEAGRVRGTAQQLRTTGNNLDSTWEGNSKNNFFAQFRPEPGNVESYAAWLEEKARNIECMTVTVWESVTVRR